MAEFLSKETATLIHGISNIALLLSLVVGAASTALIIWTGNVKESYLTKEVSEANTTAEKARENAAFANKETEANKKKVEQLKLESTNAKADLLKTQERLKKMQEIRRISKDEADTLCSFFKSDNFINEPKLNLRIASVSDTESQMYAMELLSLLKSCDVNVYPTPGGNMPNEIIQLNPSKYGLNLTVHSLSNPVKSFALLQHLLLHLALK